MITSAQIFNPVTWDFSQKQVSDHEIELQFKATIDEGWYLYSQFIDDDGPVPTEFTFTTKGGYSLVGTPNEGVPIEEFDPNFDMILKYFGHEAIFTQIVQVSSAEDFNLDGNVYFMVCDEAQCLPPEEVEFSFEIKGVEYIIKEPEIYRNKNVVIAGGGDSALDWVIFLADVAKSAGVESVVFDRNGYLYHGRVKALAESARENGLKF